MGKIWAKEPFQRRRFKGTLIHLPIALGLIMAFTLARLLLHCVFPLIFSFMLNLSFYDRTYVFWLFSCDLFRQIDDNPQISSNDWHLLQCMSEKRRQSEQSKGHSGSNQAANPRQQVRNGKILNGDRFLYSLQIIIRMRASAHLVHRLPLHFRSDPLFVEVAKSFETSHVRFSGLFLRDGASRYLLNKDDDVLIDLDWRVYSIVRASSRMILTTGGCLKAEKKVFQTRETYGDPLIDQIYEAYLGKERQKLIAFTRSFTPAQLERCVNPFSYDLLPLPSFNSLPQALANIKTQHNPILLEFGMQMMDQYFKEVKDGEKNEIDTLLIATYDGGFHRKYKGGRLQFPLEELYDLEWKSKCYPCELGKDKGEVEFEIYRMKK